MKNIDPNDREVYNDREVPNDREIRNDREIPTDKTMKYQYLIILIDLL